MWHISKDERLVPLLRVKGIAEPYNAPRQALPPTYWQTGHIDVVRRTTIVEGRSMSGEIILPVVIDAAYTVDIDTLRDWQRGEWLLTSGELDVVLPGPRRRALPGQVRLLVMDFDGVLTDDRVWVDEAGVESVAASRSDGMGIARLRAAGIEAVVLSSETNPVVTARCRKLGIEAVQGVSDKAPALEGLLQRMGIVKEEVVYVGNDLNDLPCFPIAGWAVAVADATPAVRAAADYVLSAAGGRGGVRELCELILANCQLR
jgi:N-acylneuraminate cytidylyltransferase